MHPWFTLPDWRALLLPSAPLLELAIRGTAMYLGLFVLLRIVLKRHSGKVGIADLIVVVIIADASQNGLAGQYTSVTDGLLLVSVILFWSFAVDWLGYKSPRFQRLVVPRALPLVRDGQLLHENMRRELITHSELMSQLREQGVASLEDVALACIEGTGQISVVPKERTGEVESHEPQDLPRGPRARRL
jgi:uncharacterized membrane protein YcaP (DUF421 family)